MMITYTVKVNDSGTVRWYNEDGLLHRLDGPAVEYADGSKEWWVNGKLHRLDGPAVESSDGFKSWWLNGKLHRLDGPAVEWANGYKSWYQNGNLHRLDGPAVCGSHGGKQWYIGGVKYTEEKFLAKIEIMNCPCKGKKVIVDGVEYTLI